MGLQKLSGEPVMQIMPLRVLLRFLCGETELVSLIPTVIDSYFAVWMMAKRQKRSLRLTCCFKTLPQILACGSERLWRHIPQDHLRVLVRLSTLSSSKWQDDVSP